MPKPTPASRARGITAYATPPYPYPIDLHLDVNEGLEPAPELLGALTALPAERIRRYARPTALEAKIASRLGIDPSRVVAANGGDDAIDRACRATLETGRTAVLHEPTFEMIPRGVRLAGGDVRSIPWLGGAFPADDIIDAIDETAGLVGLVTPNNPTATSIPPHDLLSIVDRAESTGTTALIDLAYVEFANHDPTPDLLDRPNVIMIRTFSKAFGLAGARIGYAVTTPEIASWLRTVGGPFPIATPSLALAEAALDLDAAAYLNAVREERVELADHLRAFNAAPLPSDANFVLARFENAPLTRDALAAQGIGVRGFGDQPILASYLRITLPGRRDHFDRLKSALERASRIRTPDELEALRP